MEKAIYCATWTPSRRMHLDDRGMIAPGKIADFMLLDSLDGIDPVVVYKEGRVCVLQGQGGLRCGRSCGVQFPASFYHTINCRPAEISDFVLKAEDPDAKWAEVNVMKIGTFGTATTPVKRRVEVKDGVLDWKSAGLSPCSRFRAVRQEWKCRIWICGGRADETGRCNTTWSHDSHNLFVLGTDENDMKLAQRRVLELQGHMWCSPEVSLWRRRDFTIPAASFRISRSRSLGQELKEVRGGDGRSRICEQQRDHVYVHALSSGVSEVEAHRSRAFDGAGAGTCAVG